MQFGPYLLTGSSGESGVWSLRIPGFVRVAFPPAFPADCPHRSLCHGLAAEARSAGYSEFPAYSRILQRPSQRCRSTAARLTVIVTAAVHWGFGSSREALPLTFQHWAGVSPYTSPYGLAETCVFGKQSPGPAPCGPRPLREQVASPPGALLIPKLRSYFAEFLNEGYPDHLRVLTPAHQSRFAVRAPTVLATRLFLPV
jgi:hypothetical protein